MNLIKKPKPRSFEIDQGYSAITEILGLTWTPRILKGLSITLLSAVLIVAGGVILIASVIPGLAILRPLSWILMAAGVVGNLFGENGRRFLFFLIPVTRLRTVAYPMSEKPVSREIVRIWSYVMLSLEFGIRSWWMVFTAPPQPLREDFADRLLWLMSLRYQAADQFITYVWLLPVLCFAVLGLLKLLEWFPVVGWVLRLTRLVSFIIVPLAAILESLMIYRWWEFTFKPVL